MTRAQEKTSQKQQNLSSMLKSFDSALKSHHFTINNVQMAQNALSKRLEQFGRNVKVTMDETGRFTATLTNMRNQTVKMSGGFDVASGKLTNLKRSVTTTNDAVDQMRRKTKEAVRVWRIARHDNNYGNWIHQSCSDFRWFYIRPSSSNSGDCCINI